MLGVAPDEVTGEMLLLALLPVAVCITKVTDGTEGVRAVRTGVPLAGAPGWCFTALFGLPVLTIGLTIGLAVARSTSRARYTSSRSPPARSWACSSVL